MIIFFDTETTAIIPGRIIQLSYIMQDENQTVGKNFFFGVDYISPQASAVHGFTVDKLRKLAGDNTFSTHIDEIEEDFNKADLIVAHNLPFDVRFMSCEFEAEYRVFRYKNSFDTMREFTPICKLSKGGKPGYKYPKLLELTEFLEIYPYDITRCMDKIFNTSSANAHDARFDTVALYLAFNESIKEYPKVKEVYDNFCK